MSLHHNRVRRSHVHLNDAVVVVADGEGAMSVHSAFIRNYFMLTLAITNSSRHYSFFLHLLNFLISHIQISHLRPNWKTVNFKLVLNDP